MYYQSGRILLLTILALVVLSNTPTCIPEEKDVIDYHTFDLRSKHLWSRCKYDDIIVFLHSEGGNELLIGISEKDEQQEWIIHLKESNTVVFTKNSIIVLYQAVDRIDVSYYDGIKGTKTGKIEYAIPGFLPNTRRKGYCIERFICNHEYYAVMFGKHLVVLSETDIKNAKIIRLENEGYPFFIGDNILTVTEGSMKSIHTTSTQNPRGDCIVYDELKRDIIGIWSIRDQIVMMIGSIVYDKDVPRPNNQALIVFDERLDILHRFECKEIVINRTPFLEHKKDRIMFSIISEGEKASSRQRRAVIYDKTKEGFSVDIIEYPNFEYCGWDSCDDGIVFISSNIEQLLCWDFDKKVVKWMITVKNRVLASRTQCLKIKTGIIVDGVLLTTKASLVKAIESMNIQADI